MKDFIFPIFTRTSFRMDMVLLHCWVAMNYILISLYSTTLKFPHRSFSICDKFEWLCFSTVVIKNKLQVFKPNTYCSRLAMSVEEVSASATV